MKVIGFFSDTYIIATNGGITRVSNNPFPNGDDNIFIEPVGSLPEMGKHGSEVKMPERYKRLFDENGNRLPLV